MIRAPACMGQRVGCCGNGGRLRSRGRVDQTAVPYTAGREWFTLAITVTPTAPPKPEEQPAEKKPGSKPPPSAKEPKSEEGEAAKTSRTRQVRSAAAQAPAETARRAAAAEDVLLYIRRVPGG